MKLLWFSLQKCDSCEVENYVVIEEDAQSAIQGLIIKLDLKPSEAARIRFKREIMNGQFVTMLPGGTAFIDING